MKTSLLFIENTLLELITAAQITINNLIQKTNPDQWEIYLDDEYNEDRYYEMTREIFTEDYDDCDTVVGVMSDGKDFVIREGANGFTLHPIEEYPIEVLVNVIRQLEKEINI